MFVLNSCVCLTPDEAKEIASMLDMLTDFYNENTNCSEDIRFHPREVSMEILKLVKYG